jgi:hypothetical protein
MVYLIMSATAVICIQQVLPITFVRTYLANIEGPQTMVLESFASGWEWQVTYTNESFEEGWRVFATDYDLESGDLIRFQLKVEFRFTVQVYNKLGCEKFSSFDMGGASNTWTYLGHRATAASEGMLTCSFLLFWLIFLYHAIEFLLGVGCFAYKNFPFLVSLWHMV